MNGATTRNLAKAVIELLDYLGGSGDPMTPIEERLIMRCHELAAAALVEPELAQAPETVRGICRSANGDPLRRPEVIPRNGLKRSARG
jgi:hypothetical protein